MSRLGKKIPVRACVFTFSIKLEKWSFHVADLSRTGKKCTYIKKQVKGVQRFCFRSLNMQNLWRCRCRRVVGLKLPNVSKRLITVVTAPRKDVRACTNYTKFLLMISNEHTSTVEPWTASKAMNE